MGAPAIRLNALVHLAWALIEEGDLHAARARGEEALEMARVVLGGYTFLALPLEVMAQIAAAADQPVPAIRLASAAAARRESSAMRISPDQREQLERWLHRRLLSAEEAIDAARATDLVFSAV